MPFPNHPEKYDAEPLITPERSTTVVESDVGAKLSGVVLCYSETLLEYVIDTYEGTTIDRYLGDLHVIEESGGTVGVLGNFGVGGPVTAMLMEELIAEGVETFLSIGYAGCLTDDVEMGEFVVCERAIRDEGTSHHYVESGADARPSATVVSEIEEGLRARDEPFHVGASWTTDAPFRETTAEIERYAAEGVLTVEMEAATVYTVADYRGVDAAALFVVSDYLGPSEWDPKFEVAQADLARLCDAAVELLAAYIES